MMKIVFLLKKKDDSFRLLRCAINTGMYHKDGVHQKRHGPPKLADNSSQNFTTFIVIKIALEVSMGTVASQISDIIAIVNLEVSMGTVASQVTDIINMVNLKVSQGLVANQITDILTSSTCT